MNILRNAQRRLTLPSFHASLGGELALPDVPRKVVVMGVNNVGELKLTVSRLTSTAPQSSIPTWTPTMHVCAAIS